MAPALIIAEAGSNHDKSLKRARALVETAARACCDIIKFQTYSAETLYSSDVPDFATYKNVRELIKGIELPREWQGELKKMCDDIGIEFMSTPFDERAVDELVKIGVKRMKVAGFEATDPRFLSIVASANLPMIVTVGINTDEQTIVNVVSVIRDSKNDKELILLHGNHAYPTPFDDINLSTIVDIMKLGEPLGFKVGLSDHTLGTFVPPIAVALGAVAIEKHFTLNRLLSGPDHQFAVEPHELTTLVKNVRLAERCLSKRSSKITTSESQFFTATRSVVSARKIAAGEEFSADNITTKRPHVDGAVPASDFFKIIGKTAVVDIEKDVMIMKTMTDRC